MTDATPRDPIFRDMARQMTPDAELRRRLDEQLDTEPAGRADQAGPTTTPSPSRWSRPNRWLAAAAAAVLVAGVGGGVVATLRDDGASGTATTSPALAADYDALYEAVAQASVAAGTDLLAEQGLVVPESDGGTPNAAAPDTASGDYTTTNLQVAGIDEADVVKTDGQVLYAATDQHVAVVDLAGADTRRLTQIDLGPSDQVTDLLLHHDQGHDTLVVIAQEHDGVTPLPRIEGDWVGPASSQMVVRLYDVTDPATPALRTTSRQSGSYRAARLSQGVVYLVSDYPVWSHQIVPTDPTTFVPLVGGSDDAAPLSPGDVVLLPRPNARYAVATAVDLRSGERTGQQAVLGGADTVYMSPDSLYLGGLSYPQVLPGRRIDRDGGPPSRQAWTPTTSLARLSLDDGQLTVAATGSVPGRLLNQFSLDEHDGRLRVVTTSQAADLTSSAGLYVLDADLHQVGSVTDLAHDEQVQSVRFAGTVGYVVTFRQTDPLFAIDLSDPTHPTVMSQLKIPGFSAYLHPWGTNRLVGLGYAGNDTGLTGGLKLSLFDIADPYAVTEAQSALATGDWSEAFDDHRAVFVDPDHDLIGFPVSIWGTTDVQGSGALHYLVYAVDPAAGFSLQHDLVVTPVGGETWQARVRATRSGEYLYVSWNGGLDVFQTADGTLVAQLDLR